MEWFFFPSKQESWSMSVISEFHEAGRSVVQGQRWFHKKFDKSHLGSETLSLVVPAYNLSTNENEAGGL